MLVERSQLLHAKRLVVKVGSSSLTGADGRLDVQALRSLVDVLAERRAAGTQVVLVSSGAIAAGLTPLGLPTGPRDLATAQAAASVGQGLLIARYTEAFNEHDLRVGQVLLTAEDLIRRGHYRNAQRALNRLLDLGVVPVVNENDTVATDEIRFGDNDRLAALVSHLVQADAMVLLTDVDALYDAPPSRPGAQRVEVVRTPAELDGIKVTGRGSAVGTGGMVTKLGSARIATATGIPVLLTAAALAGDALSGGEVGTWFVATGRRTATRQLWLAYAADTRGRVLLDSGAVRAVVQQGASLLPAGVTAVEGSFSAGDPIELVGPDGEVIARGIAEYATEELPGMLGRTTQELRAELGPDYGRVVVHRDSLVVLEAARTGSGS